MEQGITNNIERGNLRLQFNYVSGVFGVPVFPAPLNFSELTNLNQEKNEVYQESLIQAAQYAGLDTGYIGRADMAGFGEKLKRIAEKIQKESRSAFDRIMLLSLPETYKMAMDFAGTLGRAAQELRQEQQRILDRMHRFDEALPRAQDAIKANDTARDKNGQYINKNIQVIAEEGLYRRHKKPDDMKNMTDAEAMDIVVDTIKNADTVKKEQAEEFELTGELANYLEKTDKQLKKDIEDIMNRDGWNEEQKKEALKDRLTQESDAIKTELRTYTVTNETVQKAINSIAPPKKSWDF